MSEVIQDVCKVPREKRRQGARGQTVSTLFQFAEGGQTEKHRNGEQRQYGRPEYGGAGREMKDNGKRRSPYVAI